MAGKRNFQTFSRKVYESIVRVHQSNQTSGMFCCIYPWDATLFCPWRLCDKLIWKMELYNVCGFSCLTLPTVWRMSSGVSGMEHQRELPALLTWKPSTLLAAKCNWSSTFTKHGDDFWYNTEIGRKSELKTGLLSLSFHFIFLSSLMNPAPWQREIREIGYGSTYAAVQVGKQMERWPWSVWKSTLWSWKFILLT